MQHIQEVNGFECTWKNISGCSKNAFCCDNNPDLEIVWSLGVPNWDLMYVAIEMIVDTNSRAENVYVTK